jgi:hypothetical protein
MAVSSSASSTRAASVRMSQSPASRSRRPRMAAGSSSRRLAITVRPCAGRRRRARSRAAHVRAAATAADTAPTVTISTMRPPIPGGDFHFSRPHARDRVTVRARIR